MHPEFQFFIGVQRGDFIQFGGILFPNLIGVQEIVPFLKRLPDFLFILNDSGIKKFLLETQAAQTFP